MKNLAFLLVIIFIVFSCKGKTKQSEETQNTQITNQNQLPPPEMLSQKSVYKSDPKTDSLFAFFDHYTPEEDRKKLSTLLQTVNIYELTRALGNSNIRKFISGREGKYGYEKFVYKKFHNQEANMREWAALELLNNAPKSKFRDDKICKLCSIYCHIKNERK